MGMVFPVTAIKRQDPHRRRGFDKTSHVDVDTVWIGARGIKRLDAADSTERMLRDAGIEGVSGDMLRTSKQMKPGHRDDQVKKASHAADRAVAVFNFKIFGSFNLERDRATVTAAVIDHGFGASTR